MPTPQIAVLNDQYGVCLKGQWRGWLFRKHPDGQWVSEKKLDLTDAAPPANSALGQLIATAQIDARTPK